MIAEPIMSSNTSTVVATADAASASPTNSHDPTVDEGVEAENAAAEGANSETMKLVVRSPYWGRILKGKTRRTIEYGGIPGRPYRVIGCQAVLSAVEGQYWGCCPHHGKRVLEMKEHHFTDQFAGDWDIFAIPPITTPTYMVHGFFMLPQNQTVIDVPFKIATEGWSFVGTANASVVRMELEAMLADILKQNDSVGFRYHHVHLEVLMDQVFDRETPRSRKAAIEKARTGRGSSASSIVTPRSTNSGGDASSTGTSPPIPHVVSNDASWLSDATTAPPQHLESMPPAWSHQGVAHQYHPPQSYPPLWTSPEHALWYRHHPGAGGTITAVPHSMNPAQQLLHHGFAVSSTTILPSGYVPPEAIDHYHALSGFAPERYAFYASSNHRQYSSQHARSHWPTPVEEDDDRDDGNEAIDRSVAHGIADEKLSEDVATASVSETTADEEEESHHSPVHH